MTTAPTPLPEALRLAAWLKEGAWNQMRLGDVEAAGRELKRLHAENERLRAAERTLQHLGYQDRGGQQWAPPLGQAPDFGLIDSLRARIAELVGNRMTAQKVEAICAREPYAVTGVVLSQPDGRACIVNQSAVRWFHGARDFWNLMHSDATAEVHMVDRSPNLQEPLVDKAANLQERPAPLIASREVVSDGPVRVTRLHLSTEGRAALTTKATGPLPGITGGQS